jgi:putative ABC transport system substrate-binding protein
MRWYTAAFVRNDMVYRWAEGRDGRLAEIAAELVRLKVAVIITVGSAVPTVKQATSAISIVFAISGDPAGMGLVASLAQPGGNVTGLSSQTTDLAGKRVELLREVVPGLRRLAIMANVGYPAAVLDMREVEAATRILGLEAVTSEIQRAEDIDPGLEALRVARTHSTSVATLSSSPTAFESISWRLGRDYPRCTPRGSTSKGAV